MTTESTEQMTVAEFEGASLSPEDLGLLPVKDDGSITVMEAWEQGVRDQERKVTE